MRNRRISEQELGQQIQRRLLTATRVATSVENCVLNLNSIVLIHGDSLWITSMGEKGTAYLYKQFLWAHATMTENSRHTINPGLLVTPKHAGGIGFQWRSKHNVRSMRFLGLFRNQTNTLLHGGGYGLFGAVRSQMQQQLLHFRLNFGRRLTPYAH